MCGCKPLPPVHVLWLLVGHVCGTLPSRDPSFDLFRLIDTWRASWLLRFWNGNFEEASFVWVVGGCWLGEYSLWFRWELHIYCFGEDTDDVMEWYLFKLSVCILEQIFEKHWCLDSFFGKLMNYLVYEGIINWFSMVHQLSESFTCFSYPFLLQAYFFFYVKIQFGSCILDLNHLT